MAGHSLLLSPSASSLWMLCTAMPVSLLQHPYFSLDENSEAAKRGTLQHKFVEEVERGLIDPSKYKDYKPEEVGEGDWFTMCVDAATAGKLRDNFLEEHSGKKFKDFYEANVGFEDPWRSDCFGTADRIRVDLVKRKLIVLDYKFGRVQVSAQNNSQLRIYALAFLNRNPSIAGLIENVVLGIIQPKVSRDKVDSEELTISELLAWDKDYLTPAIKAVKAGGTFVSGEHCDTKYCKLRPVCPKYSSECESIMDSFVEEEYAEKEAIEQYDGDKLGKLLDAAERIAKFRDKLEEEAAARITSGGFVTGYKMVKKRGRYVWENEEQADKAMAALKFSIDERKPRSIITPSQAKSLATVKELSVEKLEGLSVFNEGEAKLAPESDKAPAIVYEVSLEDLLG